MHHRWAALFGDERVLRALATVRSMLAMRRRRREDMPVPRVLHTIRGRRRHRWIPVLIREERVEQPRRDVDKVLTPRAVRSCDVLRAAAAAVHARLRPVNRLGRIRVGRRRGRMLRDGHRRGDPQVVVPLGLGQQDGVSNRLDGVQVNAHNVRCELEDEGMPAVEVLALPAPAEARQHVERKPHVLDRSLPWETLAVGHLAVQNDHRRNVQRDRRRKERDIRETDELTVEDDNIVRGHDRCTARQTRFARKKGCMTAYRRSALCAYAHSAARSS